MRYSTQLTDHYELTMLAGNLEEGMVVSGGVYKNWSPRMAAAGADHRCIGGLATNYCIRATVIEALKQGFTVTVLADGVAGVDIKPSDLQRPLAER
ncbi:MAG: isochorismatase family protein [Desulfobulbaceae bacterium]|nr:isochorismatase family protein [Desulfobulbaceae bacterium]